MGAACGVHNPLFFRIMAKCTKVFTPGTSDFPRVSRCFPPQSQQNRDFYPTARLHGGFIAM
jgi:hypothetical protein